MFCFSFFERSGKGKEVEIMMMMMMIMILIIIITFTRLTGGRANLIQIPITHEQNKIILLITHRMFWLIRVTKYSHFCWLIFPCLGQGKGIRET